MAPGRGSRPVEMRHEATVTATVGGSTNSVSGSTLGQARSCAVLARDAARKSRVPPGGYFDVGSFDVAEPRRDSFRPGPWQKYYYPRGHLGPTAETGPFSSIRDDDDDDNSGG
ncbi:hypothetical protein MGYG_00168 [Nannizzia gypsea CBS 118893]|uniref:Uncharacterized protein n=1 Tax=Arthroderma gypseum (strain ATCC MYA-4604 / CBS 118893) TaxID=535722 RepID=E5R396_ARTGP|nr:hypothetical protein MGYG_00168 [Nannizzia gypsea CBS 118893]EFQ97125.1 hypothetical protein MGYG_00168 [Nannizzia gypsea CBS 118893]